jgi:hypothetical protein
MSVDALIADREQSRGSGGEQWPEPLAAGIANIRDVALDGRIKRPCLCADSFLDGVEVRVNQFERLGERNGLLTDD